MTRKGREDTQPTAHGSQQQRSGGCGAVLGVCSGLEAGTRHHDDAEDVVSRAGLWYEPAQAAGTVLGSAGLVTTSSPVVPALPTSRGVCLCALKTLLEVFHLFICLFSFPECPGLAKLFFTVFRNISSVVCQLQPAGRAGAASGVPAEGGSGTQGARGARGGGKGSGSPKGRRLLPGAARAAPQGVGQP